MKVAYDVSKLYQPTDESLMAPACGTSNYQMNPATFAYYAVNVRLKPSWPVTNGIPWPDSTSVQVDIHDNEQNSLYTQAGTTCGAVADDQSFFDLNANSTNPLVVTHFYVVQKTPNNPTGKFVDKTNGSTDVFEYFGIRFPFVSCAGACDMGYPYS